MSKQKPILNEGTVRKFMKLANLTKVGESFISEAYGHEDEEQLEEDKNFGGTKDQKWSAAKAPKKAKLKEAEEEEAVMDEPAPAEEPMPEMPEVTPAEEPSEMDASSLADQIIQVLQGAGLVDVVDDEEAPMGDEDMSDEGEEEDDDEGLMEKRHHEEEDDEEEDEDEGAMQEARKKQVAKIVAERVMKRIQKEQKIERLAETITKRVMARMSGK
jgi:hypothetical protein